MNTLIVASLAFPLVLAALVALPSCRPAALSVAPWAPLPALALAARAEPSLDLPGVLLGITLGLDATGRLFLAFTALVWLITGVFARGWLGNDARPVRYWVFWLLTLTGSLGVCLALDAVSFYLAFALMSFAAYGLIVHPGSAEARRAGRVYLTMAVLGETALVMGLILAVQGAGAHAFTALAAAPANAATAWLLIVGFGIKLGVPLLHMWLPLAHPVAPVPASAVLSGVMLKAGLLAPAAWPLLLPALGLYALHHALAKSALFLGVGLIQAHGVQRVRLVLLGLPALALAGAPLTSGALGLGRGRLGHAPLGPGHARGARRRVRTRDAGRRHLAPARRSGSGHGRRSAACARPRAAAGRSSASARAPVQAPARHVTPWTIPRRDSPTAAHARLADGFERDPQERAGRRAVAGPADPADPHARPLSVALEPFRADSGHALRQPRFPASGALHPAPAC